MLLILLSPVLAIMMSWWRGTHEWSTSSDDWLSTCFALLCKYFIDFLLFRWFFAAFSIRSPFCSVESWYNSQEYTNHIETDLAQIERKNNYHIFLRHQRHDHSARFPSTTVLPVSTSRSREPIGARTQAGRWWARLRLAWRIRCARTRHWAVLIGIRTSGLVNKY
jgi:hypothetical protein